MPVGGKLTIETSNAHLDEAYASEQPEVQAGQYVMLAISDTGVGMTKQVIASAFDPFFTTKDVGAGTGLGLSQVYGFVKQSDGHVKIYSEPGEGDIEPDAPSTPESPLPAAAGECILLVEDDERVRDLSLIMLQELGYTVLVAANSSKALDLVETRREIGLLFTDVGLPGVNGRELADRARKVRPALKVLFTTGYAHNAVVHQGRLDRGIDLLAKPFSLSALAHKLRELLNRP